MPYANVTAEIIAEQDKLLEMKLAGKSRQDMMAATGLSFRAVRRRLDAAYKRARLDPTIADRLAHLGVTDLAGLHSGWLINKDKKGSGESLYFYLGPDEVDKEAYIEALSDAFENVPPAPPIEAPEYVVKNTLAFFPIADWHLGAAITESEGGREYSPSIGVQRLRTAFGRCHAAIPPSETAVIAWLGDTTHADNAKNQTPRSGHPLQVSGSHHSNVALACHSLIWQVDMALAKHKEVIVTIRRGNHDPGTPVALILGLQGRYRDEPRVTVLDDESPWMCIRRGKVLLIGHHGDGIKPAELALTIPALFRDDWGKSEFPYLFTGHLHSRKSEEFGAIRWQQLPALGVNDQYASDMGYTDTGGMLAMCFDTKSGAASEFSVRL